MCNMVDILEKRGRAEGRAEGRVEGEIKMAYKLGVSKFEIANMVNVEIEQVEKVIDEYENEQASKYDEYFENTDEVINEEKNFKL